MSQRALARQADTDQPAIVAIERGTGNPSIGVLDQLLRGTGHSLISVPTRAFPVAVFVHEIRAQLASGNSDTAFRSFLALNDSLNSQPPGIKVVLTIADPGTTGSSEFDALVAGLVEHVLRRRRLPVPVWVNEPSRFLDQEWFVDESPHARSA